MRTEKQIICLMLFFFFGKNVKLLLPFSIFDRRYIDNK